MTSTNLKHGKQKVLLTTLVLISVDCEHDGLEKRVDLGHGHESTQVRDMPRLRLQEEHEVAISLRLVVIGEDTFLNVCRVFEVASYFILLLPG